MGMYLLSNLKNRVAAIRKKNATGFTYPEISNGCFRDVDIVLRAQPFAATFVDSASAVIREVRCLKRFTRGLAQARDLLLPCLMSREVTV